MRRLTRKVCIDKMSFSTTPIALNFDSTPPSAHVQPYDILFTIVGFLLLGIFGMLTNIFILIIIGKNVSLQSACFILICLECVFSIISAVGHISLGVHDVVQLVTGLTPIRPRWLCYGSAMQMVVLGVQGSNLVICLVAVDRLISILAPARYQIAGGGYIRGCWVLSLIFSISSSFLGTFSPVSGITDLIQCPALNPFSPLSPSFLAYFGLFNLSFSILCIILYSGVLITFKWRTKSIRDPRAAQAFLKHQQACMPTVKLLMIFYGITSVIPEIYISTMAFSPVASVYMARIACYLGPVKLTATLTQITALYFGSTKFRVCVKNAFGNGPASNAVVPMAFGNRQQPNLPRAD